MCQGRHIHVKAVNRDSLFVIDLCNPQIRHAYESEKLDALIYEEFFWTTLAREKILSCQRFLTRMKNIRGIGN